MVAVVLRMFENALDLKLFVFHGTLLKKMEGGLANAKADVCVPQMRQRPKLFNLLERVDVCEWFSTQWF